MTRESVTTPEPCNGSGSFRQDGFNQEVSVMREKQVLDFWHLAFQQNQTEEFDPGSERTLAACLTHASRTRKCLSGHE